MISLENEGLKLNIRPELGAKIDDIFDRHTGYNWLWHPQNYRPRAGALPVGSNFDQNFTGGWEEVFPSDAPGPFCGRDLPDHGELWSQSWDVLEHEDFGVQLGYTCKTVPVRVEKIITLDRVRSKVSIDYVFKNLANETIPHIFKLHPALRVEEGDEIVMPPCKIEPVVLEFSKIIGQAGRTPFPYAFDKNGERISINRVLPRSAHTQEFVYATQLHEGRCGLFNRRTQTRLNFSFSLQDLPFVWLFQSYGGWNNHHVLFMEPCTNVPFDLNTALQNNTCGILRPHETKTIAVDIEVVRKG